MSDAVLRWWKPPGQPVSQTLSASPWTFTVNVNAIVVVTVLGGLASLIEIDFGSGFQAQIGVAGVFALLPNQSIRITYVIAPTVTTVQL